MIQSDIHALWIGDKLGNIEAKCLLSFAQNGHRVFLHSYSKPHNVPLEIQVCNAEEIISPTEVFRHRETNSLGMFADIFRYELFAKIPGAVYVDCDVYCIKPLPVEDYLFGFEKKAQINGAVLSLPSMSSILNELRQIRKTAHLRWPWEKRFPFSPLRLSSYFTKSANPLCDKLWATTGPYALTYMANKYKITHLAKEIDYFYPVSFNDVSALFKPDRSIEFFVKKNTHCIHLYNEALKSHKLKLVDAPPTSAIGRLLRS